MTQNDTSRTELVLVYRLGNSVRPWTKPCASVTWVLTPGTEVADPCSSRLQYRGVPVYEPDGLESLRVGDESRWLQIVSTGKVIRAGFVDCYGGRRDVHGVVAVIESTIERGARFPLGGESSSTLRTTGWGKGSIRGRVRGCGVGRINANLVPDHRLPSKRRRRSTGNTADSGSSTQESTTPSTSRPRPHTGNARRSD